VLLAGAATGISAGSIGRRAADERVGIAGRRAAAVRVSQAIADCAVGHRVLTGGAGGGSSCDGREIVFFFFFVFFNERFELFFGFFFFSNKHLYQMTFWFFVPFVGPIYRFGLSEGIGHFFFFEF